MLHFLPTLFTYTLPLILLTLPFIILYRYKKNLHQQTETLAPEPNLEELEQKLAELIENNTLSKEKDFLQQNLQKTPSELISAYLYENKKNLGGYHLFQLIFSLIKNGAEDTKIIKILKHYFPSCATSHLYAMLKSFKAFLNILPHNTKAKEILRDLNNNQLRSTLLFLEDEINVALNKVQDLPPALQQPQIDEAMKLGLIFATFATFYDTTATEKILRLVNALSPNLFLYWHEIPKKQPEFRSKKAIFYRHNRHR